MKILLATMQYGEGYGQGTERYIAMLTSGLAARGVESAVLGGDPDRRRPGARLGDLVDATPRVLHYPSHGWSAVRGLPGAVLAPAVERERPDLIHLVNPAHIGLGLVETARALRLPLVITIVDFWWLCPKHTLAHHTGAICDGRVTWTECLRCIAAGDARAAVRGVAAAPVIRAAALPVLYGVRALLRGTPPVELVRFTRRQRDTLAALAAADAVILLSRGARDLLGSHLPPGRTHDIVVGMEPRWFDAARQAPPDPTPRDPATLTIGYVGALAAHKGPHLLLDALRRLDWTRTRVLLAGAGEARYGAQLERAAAGLNVTFVGRVPSAGMPAFLRGLDVLVVPSTWPENMPQTVIEALATRTPVLASRAAGISEVIDDPSLLFDVGSAASLAEALRRWAASPRPAPPARLSTVDEMVERTLEVYRGVA